MPSKPDYEQPYQPLQMLFLLVAIGFVVFGVGIGLLLFTQGQRTEALVSEAEETTRLLELIAADELPIAITFPEEIQIVEIDREGVRIQATICRGSDDVVEVRVRLNRRFVETSLAPELAFDNYPGLRENEVYRFTDVTPCRVVRPRFEFPDTLKVELASNPEATPEMVIGIEVSPLLQSSDVGGSTFFNAREVATITEEFVIPAG